MPGLLPLQIVRRSVSLACRIALCAVVAGCGVAASPTESPATPERAASDDDATHSTDVSSKPSGVAATPSSGPEPPSDAREAAAANLAAEKLAKARRLGSSTAAIRVAIEGYSAAMTEPDSKRCKELAAELLAEMKRRDAASGGRRNPADPDLPLKIE